MLIFDPVEDLDVDTDEQRGMGTRIDSISRLPAVCWSEGKQ